MTARRISLALVAVVLAAGAGHAAGPQASGGDIFAGFQANSKDPIQVDAKTLEIYEENKQRISVFSGNVVVTRGPTVMKASTMRLYSAIAGAKDASGKDAPSKDAKTGGFTRIEAAGPVSVVSGDQSVTGANAVVDMKAQIMTLTGNVVLTRGKDIATGDRLTVDMRTGRARIDQTPGKGIRVLISPESAQGVEPGAKGKTPPTQ
jgi:lipopolysaccharide export system protein LptA